MGWDTETATTSTMVAAEALIYGRGVSDPNTDRSQERYVTPAKGASSVRFCTLGTHH